MNELDELLDPLKDPSVAVPPPAKAKSWIHHIPHSWLHLDGSQGNCDELPSRLTPKTGCPRCGSVWTEIYAVAFPNTCHTGSLLPGCHVQQHGAEESPLAVRLWCFKNHLVEFDGYELQECEPPKWSTMSALLVGSAVMAMYVGRVFAQVKK